MIGVRENYNNKAGQNQNQLERKLQKTYDQKAFNNWIKSVVISIYTKEMCRTLQSTYDIQRNKYPLLHVLDIGCGRGQDIRKWQVSRVKYMVATDFSQDCLKVYQDRWRKQQPFRLYTVPSDFTTRELYNKIEHSYYDLVSAQFCLHYMFGTKKGVENGMASVLSNLLIGGVFIATIPDSYSILRKIKEKGRKVGDNYIYGNKYFSMKFQKINFTQPFGNQYGFYLQGAVGDMDEEGNILYTNQYLISLDHLEEILNIQGTKIQQTWNFLEFYQKYREQYKQLFYKFGLNYKEGEEMDPDLWEICHLYRVLICRKVDKGKKIKDFPMKDRNNAMQKKEIKRRGNMSNSRGKNHYSDRRGGNSSRSYDNKNRY